MPTKIVAVGNLRRFRIPKTMPEHGDFVGKAELRTRKGSLVLRSVKRPRDGWAEKFKKMAAAGDDCLLQESLLNDTLDALFER